MPFLPELLSPAGNLEKLKVAVLYGADAVYLSGQRFGMRAGADNFTNADIVRGAAFARDRGVAVYVTINTFFHDEDFTGLIEFCDFLSEQGVAAAIVSDLGVVDYIRRKSALAVHVSTQSSCLNIEAARVWKDAGASRIVVGRELSIEQSRAIKESAGIEVEMFIHGSMCMAYSGNCVISNFTAGRDSNRGGCIQSCRYKYTQTAKRGLTVIPERSAATHFISSKDMLGVTQTPHFVAAGIDSLKIEGRMKSALYVATTTAAYRRALDSAANGAFTPEVADSIAADLNAIPHRDYIPASFENPAPDDSTHEQDYGTTDIGSHRFAGLVLDTSSDLIAVRSNTTLAPGSDLEFIRFDGQVVKVPMQSIYDCEGNRIERTKPGCVFCLQKDEALSALAPFSVAREEIRAL